MMNALVPVAILFLGCLPVWAQDGSELEVAEAELVAAREAKNTAYDALEALILELQDDYEALTEGPDAPTLKHQLVLAMVDSLEAARAAYAAEEARSGSLQRGTRRRLLSETFAVPVRELESTDPRLALWIAQEVAHELSRSGSLDDVTENDVLRVVNQLLTGDLNWFEFWNEHIRGDRAEARHWEQAVLAYEAAGVEVNRLKYPERYGPRGKLLPPGMVVVPGGSYDLGPNTGWERPERRVTLDHFAIDRHEVTCGMYALFVNALPMDRRDEMLPRGWDLDESGWSRFGDSQRDQPVVYVDLDQAMAYAAWAGKRLPTEDEWEAAAAGLERWVYPWGNDFTAGRTNGDGRHDFTLPVESFPESRSPAGCFDMSGNVWEWTTTYEDGTDFDEPPEELINVSIRGGAFNSPRDWLTTRYRWAAPGRDTFGSPRYTFPIGFRCAKDLR